MYSSFLIKPGKKNELLAQADVRLNQAVLGDVLADNSRSSLKAHIYRGSHASGSDGEDEKEKDDEEGEVETVVLANFIPGVVRAPRLLSDSRKLIVLLCVLVRSRPSR